MNREYAQIFKEPQLTQRVGNFGEYIVKKLMEMKGLEVKKSDIKTVDLVCYNDKGAFCAIEVKTHKGTEEDIPPSPEKFHCLHIENRILDNLKNYGEKYRIFVYVFWVQSSTGKIYYQHLDELMREQTFNNVTFPRRSPYTDAPKTAFSDKQFCFYLDLSEDVCWRLQRLSEQINEK